jgi:hypothetical protein
LAHYAGFLFEVPLQIVAVAGMPLASGVTATFLFYVFFCAVIARVLTAIFQLVALPLLALVDRVGAKFRRKMDWSHQRRFVRTHTETIKWEGYVWGALQIVLFLLTMLGLYVKFAFTAVSAAGLVGSIIVTLLSVLVRCGFFLQPKPRVFVRKIKTRRVRYARAASSAFVTVTAALTIAAFFMGSMRASLLRDQAPHMLVSKDFTGLATIIASSEGALLLFQKQEKELRYIYSAPNFTTSMETKPVFAPIGSDKKH